jgi:peptidase C39-like protein
MPLSRDQIKRIAGLELNALNFTQTVPDVLERGRIRSAGTPVYDINGTVLFNRVPIMRGRSSVGYADIGNNEALGEPLLATSIGIAWNERAILKEAAAAARKGRRSLKYNRVRFVAYSYPKIAVQFLQGNQEVLMLEWKTWAEVPSSVVGERAPMKPSNFERWSIIDEMPAATRRSNARNFKKRLDVWDTPKARKVNPAVINRNNFEKSKIILRLTDTREVHYAPRTADHHPCYELRGQQTNVWCVGASVEMLLNFYRYQYDQIRLADELGLGTCDDPNGLPYSQVAKVVTVIEDLTSNALNATMHTNPGWTVFRDEIRANRPLISFVPGHSRTVIGYTQSMLHLPGKLPFKGLLVYDPWPPTDCATPDAGGVITKWENFATHNYQFAYSAVLQHI